MIKDHELSEKLINNAKEVNCLVNDSLFWVRNKCSQKELEAYRRAVAHVLAEIFDRIIEPISKEHPDLDPLKKYEESKEKTRSREEDIPAYDSEAPPMMERLYHIQKSDGTTIGMTIHLRKPAKSKDGDDWYCTWQIASDLKVVYKKAFGVDAMDSFNKALDCIDEVATEIIGKNKVTWGGGVGLCLPRK